jgi:hypothetical protein
MESDEENSIIHFKMYNKCYLLPAHNFIINRRPINITLTVIYGRQVMKTIKDTLKNIM